MVLKCILNVEIWCYYAYHVDDLIVSHFYSIIMRILTEAYIELCLSLSVIVPFYLPVTIQVTATYHLSFFLNYKMLLQFNAIKIFIRGSVSISFSISISP